MSAKALSKQWRRFLLKPEAPGHDIISKWSIRLGGNHFQPTAAFLKLLSQHMHGIKN